MQNWILCPQKPCQCFHKYSKICKVFGALHIFGRYFLFVKACILRDSCKRPSVSTISKLLSAVSPDCKSSNIFVSNPFSTCFSYEGNNSLRSFTDQQLNSVVVLVIPPGHSLCKLHCLLINTLTTTPNSWLVLKHMGIVSFSGWLSGHNTRKLKCAFKMSINMSNILHTYDSFKLTFVCHE